MIAHVALAAVVACGGGDAAGGRGSRANPADTNVVPNALPYTVAFNPVQWTGATPLPALQSYTWASVNGSWLIFGGRRWQGLHKFNQTGQNFPVDSSNMNLWVINPGAQTVDSFPARSLPPALWPLLTSTNQNFYYDAPAGLLYTTGGYGWNADASDMVTFGHITALNPKSVMDAIASNGTPDQVTALFRVTMDRRFAVTGGALVNLNGIYYLAFGQLFNGQYRPFGGGGGAPRFTQVYTNVIAQFTLAPGTLPPRVNTYTTLTSADTSQPFHRRDGNFVEDINPATRQPRLGGYGGVFLPGVIGAYSNAVYADPTGATVDTSLHQRFNAYTAPVISACDSAGQKVYHTFYGGISGYFYYQTHAQDSVFKLVTTEGRNDGLPFVADISTLVHDAAGAYKEWILPFPTTTDTLLVGASASFIPDDAAIQAGVFTANGHVRLNALAAGQRVRVGWIYGGIQAQNPLPVFPSTGTAATNLLQEVWITNAPMGAIPASAGTSAKPNYPVFGHGPPAARR